MIIVPKNDNTKVLAAGLLYRERMCYNIVLYTIIRQKQSERYVPGIVEGETIMSDFIKREICEGVDFCNIRDDRFKAGRISVNLITPLDRSTAAANALLSWVLTRSCKKYPDITSLSRKLNDLYGAALYPSVLRSGDYQLISITASGLDDRYSMDGESVSSELADLLCSIIFDPKLVDGHFDDEDVEQERRQLLEDIDAEYNDKRLYSIKRCLEIMCRDELYSIGRCGSREDVEALSHGSIVAAWKRLLDNSKVRITMLGSADPDKAFERFSAFFADKPRKFRVSPVVVPEVREVKRIVETDEISQSKLVMGYRCKYPENNRERIASTLMSTVLGGTPTSKLFENVREKQSLCYYCSSMVENKKGLMLISSGVETENIEKTEKAITDQVELLMRGVISDDEFDSAKLALKNAFISVMDNLAAMESFYLNYILSDQTLSPAESVQLLETITKEDVTALASHIKLDTVFSLVGN